jgi:hypothetical protein
LARRSHPAWRGSRVALATRIEAERSAMAAMQCEVCGNQYDKSFQVVLGEQSHTFDSFECAIQALAPVCTHCKCRIIGHGMEANGKMYCCAHCATHAGTSELRDRV